MRYLAFCLLAVLHTEQPRAEQESAKPDAVKPDARELLRKSAAALKKYSSYEIHSLSIIETHGGMNNRVQMPTKISVHRPGKMRIESESEAAAMTVVSDGERTYIYMEPQNKYIKRAAATSPESALGETGLLKNIPDISKSIKSVEITGEKEMEIDGENYDCWVVETLYDSIRLPAQRMTITEASQISWISKTLGMTLQNSFTAQLLITSLPEPVRMVQATTTMELKLNPELPDSLFTFTPPEGAKETPDWTLPGVSRPDVEGHPAPALRLSSLDARTVDLAALKGKVVLLDFWVPWSSVSKKDLTELERIYKEYRDKGLTVVGITPTRDRAAVERAVKAQGLSFPVAKIDEEAPLLQNLAVSAFPTVVIIDREGKVAAYEVGVRGAAGLRAMLSKAGMQVAPPAPTPPKTATLKSPHQ